MENKLLNCLLWIGLLFGMLMGRVAAQNTYATSSIAVPIDIQNGDTLIICEGERVDFTSSKTGLSYTWDFDGATLSCNSFSPTPIFSRVFNHPGFYSAEITTVLLSGIVQRDEFFIKVVPSIIISPLNQTICRNSEALPVRLNGLNPQDSVVWSSPNVTPSVFPRIWRVNLPSGIGMYNYTATVYRKVIVNGQTFQICNESLTVNFNVVNSPNFTISGGGTLVCPDDSVILRVNPGSQTNLVEWASSLRFNHIIGTGPSIRVASPVSQRYFAKVTSMSGCVSIESTNINLRPRASTPTIVANQTTVYIGDTLYLSNGMSPTGYGAIWRQPDGFFRAGVGPTDSIVVPILSVNQAGWYELKNNGWTGICPSLPERIYITVLSAKSMAPIDVTDGDTIVVCTGETVHLKTILPLSGAPYDWDFNGAALDTQTAGPIVSVVFNRPGFYDDADVEDQNSLEHDFAILVVDPPTGLGYIVTSPACGGDTIQLVINSAQSTDSIKWDPLVNTTSRVDSAWVVLPRWINPPPFQQYRVALKEQHRRGNSVFYGCPIVDTLEIAYDQPYGTYISQVNSTLPVCNGGTAILRALTPMGPQPDSIIWYSDSMRTNQIGVGDSLLWHNLRQDTVVYMEAKGNNACAVLDSFHIRVSSRISFSLNTTLVNGCPGILKILTASSVMGATYAWSTQPTFDTIIGMSATQTVRLRPDVRQYYVRIQSSTGCVIDTVGVQLYPPVTTPLVFANQVTDSIDLQIGDTLVLQNGQTGGDGTNWTGPGLTRLGVNNLFQDSIQKRLLASAQEGWYIGQNVAASLGQCPSLPDSVYVTVRPAPTLTVTVGGHLNICLGESTTLQLLPVGGVAPFSYRWDTSTTFSSSLLTTTDTWTVSPTTTTVYYYQVTDYLGNSITGTTQVTVTPDAGLDLVLGSNETCFPVGAPITLVATTSHIPHTDIVQYQWDSTLFFSSFVDTTTAQGDSTYQVQFRGNLPQGEYWYYVRITDNKGCRYTDSVFFKIGTSLGATTIAGNRQLCVGNNIVLSPDPNNGFVNQRYWLSPNNDTLLGRLLRVRTDSSHYLTGRWSYIQNGPFICPDTTLVDLDLDVINFGAGLPLVVPPVCYGGSALVRADTLANNNAPLSSYHWLDPQGDTLASGVDRITRSNLFSNDTVYLEVTTSGPFNCTYQVDTLEILVGSPGPPLPVTANDSLICIGNTLLLTTQGLAAATFYWQHPDGTVSVTTDPFYQDSSVNLSDSGTYRLWISDGQGCFSDTTDILIGVNRRPTPPVVNPSGTVQFCHNDTLELTGLSTGCDLVFWRAPNGRRVDDDSLANHRLRIPSILPNQDTGLWYLVCLDTMTTCRRRSSPINVQLHPRVLVSSRLLSVSPICYGDTGVFEIGNANLAYWYADTTSGQATATLGSWVIPNLQQDTIGYLRRKDNVTLCFSDYVADTIEVLPAIPVPRPDTTITVCYNTPLNLTISAIAGFSYQWNGPNNYQNSTTTLAISAVDSSTAGVYTVFATDGNNCFSDTAEVMVIFHAPSQPMIDSLSYVCFGDKMQFGLLSGGTCDSVQWHRGTPWWNPTYTPVSYYQDSVTLRQGDGAYQRGGSFWYMECINTTTGCVDTSNRATVVIEDSLDRYTTGGHPLIVCEGDSVVLRIQNPYRWYNPIYYQYRWYADAAATILVDSGYPDATAYNITSDTTFYLIVSTTFGTCRSNPIPTPVTLTQPLPPILSGDSLVCEGDRIRLITQPQILGTDYRWNSNAVNWGNDSITRGHQFLVTNNATLQDTGYYTLQTRLQGGCWSERDTLQVQVSTSPLPPLINGSTVVCDGAPIVLIADGTCSQYQWVGIDVQSGYADTMITTSDSLILTDVMLNYRAGVQWQVSCLNAAGCIPTFSSLTNPIQIESFPVVDSMVVVNGPDICLGDTALAIGYVPLTGTNGGKWYGDLGLSSRLSGNDTLSLITTQDTTVYYVVNSSSSQCSTILSVDFTVSPLPARPSIVGDTALCAGEDLNLSVSRTAIDYYWNGPSGFISRTASVTLSNVNASETGWYTVQAQDRINGCWSLEDSLWVTVNPVPTAGVTPSAQTLCAGETATLVASPIGNNYRYDWYHINPFSGVVPVGSGQLLSLSNIQWSQTGSYYVVAGQGNCFDTSGSVSIQVDTPTLRFPAQAMVDTALCGGDSILLQAQGNYLIDSIVSGVWTDASGQPLDALNSLNTWVNGLAIGRQTFYWSLSVGACIDYSIDTVVVDFVPFSGGIANVGNDQVLCNRNVLILDANPDNLLGAWRQIAGPNIAGILQPTDPNTLINGLQVGNYQLVWELIHPSCGIYDSDTLSVDVILPPNILADGGLDAYICGPDALLLAAVSPNDSLIYGKWTTNSGAFIQDPDSAVTDVLGVPSGKTSFVWTLSTDDCEDYSSDTIVVWQTSGMVLAHPDVVLINGNNTVLADVSDNDLRPPFWAITLVTVPDAGQIFNLGNGILEVHMENVSEDQRLIYELCDTLCTSNCDTALVTIVVDASTRCAIPNIFTPNGDGVNDYFEIPCIQPTEALRIVVFNRWGDVVYQTNQYRNQWEGTHRGEPLPEGTYFYVLYRTNQEPLQGSVEIKR